MFKSMMIVALATVSLTAKAQFTLSGKVRDAKTNEALVGASIQVEGASKITTSGEGGSFELKGISGPTVVRVTFIGYTQKKVAVDVNSSMFMDILMDEEVRITDEVVVMATRAAEKSPTTFSTIQKVALQKQNFGQDLPFVLNWSPSLVTTSDAGTGIGYTGIRIRGSDATRINVTINGIPLNDSEEHGVFWVNIPDIASSTQSVQVQRGVGNSTNGAGAFGGSINLQTNTRNDAPYADIINSVGSFGTRRHTVGFGTGLKNNFAFDGRLSLIKSDGFIDRASADLKSYYLSGGYYGKKTFLKAIVFGGQETTYQSWNGVPESRLNNDVAAMLETATIQGWNAEQRSNLLTSNSRTFNIFLYKDQVDKYAQDHYQLHLSHRFSDFVTANAALHYTYGRGYFEEFKFDAAFRDYSVDTLTIGNQKIGSTDLVRRRWLDNDFVGITYSLSYEKEKINSVLGGALNRYWGDHFGEVIWTQVSALPKDFRYYFNQGIKTDFNIFWKTSYQIAEKINAFADLQYRRIDYNAQGIENDLNNFELAVNYNFLNPKLGFNYSLSENQNLYASYSIANREPVRSDFVNSFNMASPKPETLRNIEVGWRLRKSKLTMNANYYLMDYTDQLVATGKLNDVGAAIRTNVAHSYRMGVEIDALMRFHRNFFWEANISMSQNKIKNFEETLYDYGINFDEFNPIKRNYNNTDIAFSPNVIAGSTLLFRPTSGAEIGLLTKYVGKQFLDNTSNDSRQINPYLINDIRLTYAWKPSFLKELSLSLLVNNIFDVAYSSNGYTYGYLGGGAEARQNYFYPQAGRNYLLMMGCRF
jgi:iron complex outermembrane recepter protein